jgi:hypothetical protein
VTGPSRREQIAVLRTRARAEYESRVYKRAAAGILITALAVPLLTAFILMAAAGVAHGWWHLVPLMRFGTAWTLAYLLFAGYAVAAYVPAALRDWAKR